MDARSGDCAWENAEPPSGARAVLSPTAVEELKTQGFGCHSEVFVAEFSPQSTRARRAQGATFLFAFGGAWLSAFIIELMGKRPIPLLAIAIATACLIGVAYRRYRRNRPALIGEAPSAQVLRAKRMFNIINAAQWLIICLACSVLIGHGLSRWVVPCIIFIVGLHLIPLAYYFNNNAHYLTGMGLMVLAVGYPLLLSGGPTNPAGGLGAGLILWASGLRAVTADHS